jgi:hypothetical protein
VVHHFLNHLVCDQQIGLTNTDPVDEIEQHKGDQPSGVRVVCQYLGQHITYISVDLVRRTIGMVAHYQGVVETMDLATRLV